MRKDEREASADGEAVCPSAPAEIEALEAILITGFSAGAYDDLEVDAPLEEFVRAADQGKMPMAGACFGH